MSAAQHAPQSGAAGAKVHIHEEQFDGAWHPWCGRGSTAVGSDVFEATDPAMRCRFCDREWFRYGQPDWHLQAARKHLLNTEKE